MFIILKYLIMLNPYYLVLRIERNYLVRYNYLFYNTAALSFFGFAFSPNIIRRTIASIRSGEDLNLALYSFFDLVINALISGCAYKNVHFVK